MYKWSQWTKLIETCTRILPLDQTTDYQESGQFIANKIGMIHNLPPVGLMRFLFMQF